MAEMFYPTRYRTKGPWLIDSTQLLALDDAIDGYRARPLAAGVSSKEQSPAEADSDARLITFLLRHDKQLKTSSFREALVNPGAATDIALGLKYEVKLRGTTALLTLERKTDKTTLFGSSSDEQMQLDLAVEPPTSALSQEMFVVMKEWADDVQRPFWHRVIFKLKWLAALVLIIWGFVFVAGVFFPSAPNSKERYKAEARKLLAEGINSTNQQKAVELLLAIQTDYSPPVSATELKPERSPKWIVENSIGLLWLLAIAMFPEFCLGIWKGKQRLRLWRFWLPIVFVTVPTMFVVRYLQPQLFIALDRVLGFK